MADPTSDDVFAGHCSHAADFAAENVPAGQTVHAVDESVGEYVPAGHSIHSVVLLLVPDIGMYLPASQKDVPQLTEPTTDVLLAQGKHSVAPVFGDYLPTGHLVHCVFAVRLPYVPAGHW